MTLDAVLDKARTIEAWVTKADKMEKGTNQTALAMSHNRPTLKQKKQDIDDRRETFSRPKQPMDRGICSFCGVQFNQRLLTCLACFHKCSNCLKMCVCVRHHLRPPLSLSLCWLLDWQPIRAVSRERKWNKKFKRWRNWLWIFFNPSESGRSLGQELICA